MPTFGELIRRAERNPVQALRDWRQGKTPYDTISANAGIAGGLLAAALVLWFGIILLEQIIVRYVYPYVF